MKKKLIGTILLALVLITVMVTGCTGEQGLKGSKGDTGKQGIQGVQGEQGLQGDQGLQGIAGAKGSTGTTGATGAVGATGEQGILGLPGVGYPGATGPQGPAWVFPSPVIDGAVTLFEWYGATTFTSVSGIYTVYVLNDTEYLYIGFEAVGGDYTIASSMTNTYIYAGNDWGGECWAYCAGAPGQVVGLTYFTTHHIPDPKVKVGQESRTTTAIVAVSTLVAEWQIPLAEFNMGPEDSLAFDFLSFSEGVSGWNDWIFEQNYTLK